MPSYPLVSIGVPLYNEARFLKESLSSLFAQDYPNLEIIISDNASVDDTLKLCQELASDKANVTIHSFDNNQGATENFHYVMRAAHGKYFMWASGHDLWSSNLVSACVTLLEENPNAVIAFGSSSWIDENGQNLSKFSGWTDTRGLKPIARLFTVFWGNMHPILGIIRKSALDKIQPIDPVVGSDLILLTKLALQGDFVHAVQANWQRREFRHETDHTTKLKRYRSTEFGLTRRSLLDKYFPLLRLPLKLSSCVVRSKTLNLAEKILVLQALLASIPVRYLDGKR